MTAKRSYKTGKPISAEGIARLADQGKDISGFFEGHGRMIQRVDVDFSLLRQIVLIQRLPHAGASGELGSGVIGVLWRRIPSLYQ